MEGRPDIIGAETEDAYDTACRLGEPTFAGWLACWRARAGLPVELPDGLPERCRLQLAGEPELAAELFRAEGAIYDAAIVLVPSDNGALPRDALDQLRALGAKPAAALVSRMSRRSCESSASAPAGRRAQPRAGSACSRRPANASHPAVSLAPLPLAVMRLMGGMRAVLAGAAVLIGGAILPYGAMTASAAVGHFPVPPAGRAVNTRHPDHVIGNGRPASCTSAAVVRAVAAGGRITFNCGRGPVTIVMARTASVIKTRHLVVLDGGGRVTLSGAGKRRILYSDTCAGTWSTSDCVNQPYPQIVVQNITFEDGYDGTHQATCTANIPRCWYGGVDGGGAIYVEGGQFKAVNSRFIDNRCYAFGPDLGGGAIRALAQYENRPIYITDDTFRGGRCSNGGALSSIRVQWNVLNSVFTDNKAIGWGANPASRGTPGGGSGGAIYLDGRNDNALIAGTAMNGNAAREGGGAVFDVVDTGWGALTFNQSDLHNNTSGQFQTFPGVYYDFDGHDRRPVMINSTVN